MLHKCEDDHDCVYKICCSLLQDIDNNGVIAHIFTKSKLSLDETKLLCNVYTDTVNFYLCDEDDNKIALDEDIYFILIKRNINTMSIMSHLLFKKLKN